MSEGVEDGATLIEAVFFKNMACDITRHRAYTLRKSSRRNRRSSRKQRRSTRRRS
jgi:hypothetical protein